MISTRHVTIFATGSLVLYCIGDLHLLSRYGIAMVGTRMPTAYGRKIATMLSEELVRSGFMVVSGMARGIDSVVHDTALRSGGPTVAVLGAGVDVIYPPENRSLYEEIAAKGLIISEYPPGTKALPGSSLSVTGLSRDSR